MSDYPRKGLCAECGQKIFIHKSYKTGKEYATNTTNRREGWHNCKKWKVKGTPKQKKPDEVPITTEGANETNIHRPLEFIPDVKQEEFKVTFTSAVDLPDIPNFYRVTKIIVSREDNKWFSAEDSDKNYGKGKSKTEGYGKKPKVILEARIQTSDRLTIENVMEDLATIVRIHNKRELQQ